MEAHIRCNCSHSATTSKRCKSIHQITSVLRCIAPDSCLPNNSCPCTKARGITVTIITKTHIIVARKLPPYINMAHNVKHNITTYLRCEHIEAGVMQQSLLAMLWSTQGHLDLATVMHCLRITHLHCIAHACVVYNHFTPITNISLSYPFGPHSGPVDGNLIAFVHNYIQSQ
jgi:hypothetical protein